MIFLFKDTTPAAGVAPPSPLERLPVTYGITPLTLNNPASPIDNVYELDNVAVVPMSNQVIEIKQGKDGSEGYQLFKNGLTIRLQGYVRAPTLAALAGKMQTLAFTFDPAILSRRTALTTIGFLPLYFSVPTTDLANYPSGLVDSFISARAMEPVTFGRTKYDGYSVPFRIDMLARDPRRYFATLQVKNMSGGVVTIDNSLASYHSWPITYITMSGAGSATATLTMVDAFGATLALVLNLSTLTNGQTLVVDHERKMITLNGTPRMDLFVSGYYHVVEAGGTGINTVTVTNATNISSLHYDFYRAFVL